MNGGWRSVHLFIPSLADADGVVLGAAAAVARHADDAGDWFFIRYTEAGPHVRLRLGPGIRAAHDAVVADAAEHVRRVAARAAGAGAATLAEPFGAGSAAEIAYEPEVQRYGGPDALIVNERLFRVSTRVAAALVARTDGQVARRTPHAIDLMLAGIAALTRAEDPLPFLRRYALSWRETWPAPPGRDVRSDGGALRERYRHHLAAAVHGSPERDGVAAWRDALAAAREELALLHAQGRLRSPADGAATAGGHALERALASFAHSQIHMLNNRLGLLPLAEIAIAESMAARLAAAR